MQSTNLEEEGLGSNYAAFSEPEVDQKIEDILMMPVEEAAAAWNELRRVHRHGVLPAVRHRLRRCRPGARLEDRGHHIDPNLGMPTWKEIFVKQ